MSREYEGLCGSCPIFIKANIKTREVYMSHTITEDMNIEITKEPTKAVDFDQVFVYCFGSSNQKGVNSYSPCPCKNGHHV